MSQALASIIDTAQVVDGFIVMIAGETYGMVVAPEWRGINSWSLVDCNRADNKYCVPFGRPGEPHMEIELVLTLGYVLLAIVIIPMGLMNLDENVSTTHTLILHDVLIYLHLSFNSLCRYSFKKYPSGCSSVYLPFS